MNIERKTLTEFELIVMDFAEYVHPKTIGEYESLADILHQCIETAIVDVIHDDDIIEDPDEYSPSY